MRRILLVLLAVWLPLSGVRAASGELVIALEAADNRPFEFEEGGRLTGFHIEVIEAVGKDLGWAVRFAPVPWQRAETMLQDGSATAVSYMAASAPRRAYALFLPGNQLHMQQVALFAMRDKAARIRPDSSLAVMAARYRIGAARNYYYGAGVNALIDAGAPIDHGALNILQLMRMMEAGRYDLVLATAGAQTQLAHEDARLASVVARVPGVAFDRTPIYLAFGKAKDGPDRAAAFAAAYARFRKTPAWMQLVHRYHLEDDLPDFR